MCSRLGVFLLALLALFAACSRSEPPAPEPGAALLFSAAPTATEPDVAAGAARERKLVRTAELRLEVQDYAAARAQIDAELERLGGYVAQASVEHADGAVASASLELRVPAAELERFMQSVARLGTVLAEQLHSLEVSDEYYDARARLGNARLLEQRLLEFARVQTPEVKALLEVERELSRVRDEIETLQGRLQGYDQRITLSSLSLQLTSRERVRLGEPLSLGGQLRQSLAESVRALSTAGRGVLLLLASLLPWLPVLAIGAYLGRRVLRRLASRHGSTQ